jgi:uncharacterized protein (DUF952 family)
MLTESTFNRMIYHVTSRQDWQSQECKAGFFPADYFKEGFIHCCTQPQLQGVLERYFKGKTDLVLLHLDESKLKPELRYETSTDDEMFPHLYGGINRESVVEVENL